MRVGRARRELVEADERGVRARARCAQVDRHDRDVGADHADLALGAGRARPDGHLDGRAGLAADPADDLVDGLAGRLLAVDRDDLVAALEPGLLGRAALEDADDERQAVLGGVDADADADVLAGQVARALRRAARGS